MKYMGWTLAAIGQVLIVLAFFVVFDVMALVGESVCWLDFVTVSLVYWVWIWTILHSPIDIKDPEGRQAAGLGIRWGALTLYSLLAFGVVATGMAMADNEEPFEFKWQLLIQIALWFFFAMSIYFSIQANEQAAHVYGEESRVREGKSAIQSEMRGLLTKAERSSDVPADVKNRIHVLDAEVRFLSPSGTAQATRMDDRIIDEVRTLAYAISNYALNREQVARTLEMLERDFSLRKSVF